jgi:hypothetical protein
MKSSTRRTHGVESSTHTPKWTHEATVLVCGRCNSRCPDFTNDLWVFLFWMGEDCQRAVTGRPPPLARTIPPQLYSEARIAHPRAITRPEIPAAKKKAGW